MAEYIDFFSIAAEIARRVGFEIPKEFVEFPNIDAFEAGLTLATRARAGLWQGRKDSDHEGYFRSRSEFQDVFFCSEDRALCVKVRKDHVLININAPNKHVLYRGTNLVKIFLGEGGIRFVIVQPEAEEVFSKDNEIILIFTHFVVPFIGGPEAVLRTAVFEGRRILQLYAIAYLRKVVALFHAETMMLVNPKGEKEVDIFNEIEEVKNMLAVYESITIT